MTSKMLLRLGEAQNWRCCYCAVVMGTDDPEHEDAASIDHYVPRASGGTNKWENLVAACRLCNNSRGAMPAKMYLQIIIWKGRRKAAHANRVRSRIQRRQALERIAEQATTPRPRMIRID